MHNPFVESSKELRGLVFKLSGALSTVTRLLMQGVEEKDEIKLLQFALGLLVKQEDFERCSVYLVDGDQLIPAASYQLDNIGNQPEKAQNPLDEYQIFSLNEGIIGKAYTSRQFQVCNHCSSNPDFIRDVPHQGYAIGSLICVPLKMDNEIFGVLNASHRETDFFDAWHQRLLCVYADILACEIANTRYKYSLSRKLEKRHEQLTQAQQSTEVQAQEKFEILSDVGKHVRSPMNAISSMLSLLRDTEMSSEQRKYTELAYGATSSLMHRLDNILDSARVESGDISLNKTSFEFRRLLDKVIDAFAGLVHRKNISITSRVAKNLPETLKGDADRIAQILNKLVANAVKHTEQGGVRIIVDAQDQGYGKPIKVTVSVIDSGPGIEPPLLKELINSDIDSLSGNSGFGLVLCRKLVEQLSGELSIESSTNGTTVSFTLELEQPSNSAKAAASFSQCSVNLICHDKSYEEHFGGLMAEWDINYTHVSNPRSQLPQLLQATGLGTQELIIFIDVEMPNEQGLHLARHIREQSRTDSLKLVALDSYLHVSQTDSSIKELFDDFVTKPLKYHDVLRAMNALYDGWCPLSDPRDPTQTVPAVDRKVRALLAENSSMAQEAMVNLLERQGMDVTVVKDGIEFLQAVKEREYDILFVDVSMPRKNGVEATNEIRINTLVPKSTPIIGLTSSADDDIRAQCLNAGMNDIVRKPISNNNIEAIYAQWLK